MKRMIGYVALALVLFAGVRLIMEATQDGPDQRAAGSSSTIEFTVAANDKQGGEPAAAAALWAVCLTTVDGTVSPRPQAFGDAWRVTVAPAIGPHGQKRLVGCLEDMMIERVLGQVRKVETTLTPDPAG
jgi:hypothetical protein